MCHMKKVSIRDLHLKTSAIVGEVAGGEVIVVEKRGVPVAELRPIGSRSPTKGLPNIEALIEKLPETRTDSGRILEEDR